MLISSYGMLRCNMIKSNFPVAKCCACCMTHIDSERLIFSGDSVLCVIFHTGEMH